MREAKPFIVRLYVLIYLKSYFIIIIIIIVIIIIIIICIEICIEICCLTLFGKQAALRHECLFTIIMSLKRKRSIFSIKDKQAIILRLEKEEKGTNL